MSVPVGMRERREWEGGQQVAALCTGVEKFGTGFDLPGGKVREGKQCRTR